AGGHVHTLHERIFCHLHLPHLQLDELRTRLRCAKQILWLAIDPRTKILPVLQLEHRTQHMAHTVIHVLRESLVPDCLPLFTSDRLNLYFYAALGSLPSVDPGGSSRTEGEAVAGGAWPDLWPGEKKLPAAQVGW